MSGAVPVGGLAVVDKPAGWSSHDVVARVRRLAGTRRVGHAGTLDPMATGVLVLGIGRATKLLPYLLGSDKAYTATIRLGQASTTDDAEGELLPGASAAALAPADVEAGMAALRGPIQQRPCAVSAIKVDGRRAYRRVREGEEVDLPPRPVTIHRFEAGAFSRPVADLLDIEVTVECSSGTYVRALARDLGAALGVGGHLTALRRTRVGPFGLDAAHTLDQVAQDAEAAVLPLPAALRAMLPVREVSAQQARELSYGRALPAAGYPGTHAAITTDGAAIALLCEQDDRARPVLVFRAAG